LDCNTKRREFEILKNMFNTKLVSFLSFYFVLFPGLASAGPNDELKVAMAYAPSTVNMLEYKTALIYLLYSLCMSC